MPKCRENRKRRLKRAKREGRRLVWSGILKHLPAVLAEIGAPPQEAASYLAATARVLHASAEEETAMSVRYLEAWQHERLAAGAGELAD